MMDEKKVEETYDVYTGEKYSIIITVDVTEGKKLIVDVRNHAGILMNGSQEFDLKPSSKGPLISAPIDITDCLRHLLKDSVLDWRTHKDD